MVKELGEPTLTDKAGWEVTLKAEAPEPEMDTALTGSVSTYPLLPELVTANSVEVDRDRTTEPKSVPSLVDELDAPSLINEFDFP